MLYGMIFSVLAGVMVSMQGIFNARLSDKIGFWHTNTFVHGSGFLVAFIIMLMFENLNFSPLKEVQPYYMLGGVMGVVIIFSVINGISSIGVSYTITLMIVTQIVLTAGINYFGYFGEPIIILSLRKVVGLALMLSGLVLYQLN